MVALLSVGISKYMNEKSYKNIPCAYDDAKQIYKVLEDVIGREFKHCCSTCLNNIMASELRCLLPLLPMSLESEDVFIFYFSGHGSKNANGRLKLVFSDADEKGKRGLIELSEIVSILSAFHCNIIIILDCCYSGSAVCEINQNNEYLDKRISILSSSGAISSSAYNQCGSVFTAYLSDAIYQLYNQQKKITLNEIYEYIHKRYSKCCIAIGGGESDISIGCDEDSYADDVFLNKFICKINTYNFELREAMWYSLIDLPDKQKIHVLNCFKRANSGCVIDMSWRVRRAIGSLISSIYELEKRKKVVRDLTDSKVWMERCIGYIGGRKDNDTCILEKMKKDALNKENPMDLVWLASLYISDRNKDSFKDDIFKTNLTETTWGVIEIWKLFYEKDELDTALAKFKNQVKNEEYMQLCLYLYLKGYQISIDKDQYNPMIWEYEEQIKDLYNSQKRGRTSGKVNKWIWSIMNGNWRDQVNLQENLRNYMRVNTKQKNKEFLQALRYTPCVEIKMGIFDYFSSDLGKDSCNKYKTELVWGIEEQHPWVIRTAVAIFRGNNELVQRFIKIRDDSDKCIYPGGYDLKIELKRQKLENIEYNIIKFSEVELSALEVAMATE